jgi:dTDP-4-amino-4,6-dideoxygalactose transaminase
MIKFFDLYKQDKKNHSKIINKIKKTITKGDYILGDEVKLFEKKFSNFVGSRYAIGCGNGTDAIILALKSLNLKKNSEVIIPAMTYCSTAFAVINAGFKPVLVDISDNSSTIDIQKINSKITNKTKVIMPVHLYGSVANIAKIKSLIHKSKKKIYIIDDCAQAHGAIDDSSKVKNKRVGSTSDISCFSLYPGKNLGAYGDAGVITTNNNKFYLLIRKLRNLGSENKFIHEYIGFNSRLDTIQASILNIKINELHTLNNKRRKIAKYYDTLINNKKIEKLKYSKNAVYHQYVIKTKNRNKFIKFLKINKIQFGFHYPKSINQLKVFKKFFKNCHYKNSENLAKFGISLPIDPNLSKKQIHFIVKTINSY